MPERIANFTTKRYQDKFSSIMFQGSFDETVLKEAPPVLTIEENDVKQTKLEAENVQALLLKVESVLPSILDRAETTLTALESVNLEELSKTSSTVAKEVPENNEINEESEKKFRALQEADELVQSIHKKSRLE